MKEVENNNVVPLEEKERKKYVITVIIICTIIIILVCFAFYYFNNKILSKEKNAFANTCVMPYSTTNCKYAKNTTVKEIQKMLNQLGYYNASYGFDGNFGPKTVAAVKSFQKSERISQDGYVGPDTLERLAKKTNKKYFIISYNKNKGIGNLKSQYNNKQVILNGIYTPISSTRLIKSGSSHVGYKATTTVDGISYRYGCFSKNCNASNFDAHKVSDIKAKGGFYDYVYGIGANVKETAWKNGQTVTFTAAYCPSGQIYNRATSSCEKASSSSSSYNKTAKLTGYGTDCCGNHGKVACYDYMPNKKLFSSSVYTYNDSQYGNVRVVAMKLNNKKNDCGTIIEIQNYKDGSTTKNAVKAIVLDTGVGAGVIDLLVTNERYASNNIGRQNIKYKVLRQGFPKK